MHNFLCYSMGVSHERRVDHVADVPSCLFDDVVGEDPFSSEQVVRRTESYGGHWYLSVSGFLEIFYHTGYLDAILVT